LRKKERIDWDCCFAEYVDHLMNWVQTMLDDEAIFPSKIGAPCRPPFSSPAPD
jgi:hypothetical protein